MRLSTLLALVVLSVLGGGAGADLTARVPTQAGGATYQQDLDAAWVEVSMGEEFLTRQTRPRDREADRR